VRAGRSLRAFRVIRLFGRLGSLRDIIAALTAAVGPVLNAFLIMFIIGSICEPPRARKPPREPRVCALTGLQGLCVLPATRGIVHSLSGYHHEA
jgi:hypothetical protein